ncbi:hypothetical protein Defa_28010 [Desulfovibrio sp. TH_2024_36128]|uniref:Uncharacterized protein n=2 Tax=Desulfovibrio TaxID=872 RepID=A0ABQ0ECG2_9BACT
MTGPAATRRAGGPNKDSLGTSNAHWPVIFLQREQMAFENVHSQRPEHARYCVCASTAGVCPHSRQGNFKDKLR